MTQHRELDLRNVIDVNVLGRLDPDAVADYLSGTGWTWVDEHTDGAIWILRGNDRVGGVVLPDDSTCADYALRMASLLSTLAAAEDRPRLAILADLCAAQGVVPSGVERIAAERRQLVAEGWSAEHDEEHRGEELAAAAVCYAVPPDLRDPRPGAIPDLWPFESSAWKPTPNDRIRELMKAGALIAAEIDRLLKQADEAEAAERCER